ncbi:MAG: tail fiber domain-containing protein [Bacteroidetes bacterium]|nr:tail fiber domain-containing protein [Bacteroidota bacterium]
MKQINYNKVRRTAFFASVVAMFAFSQQAQAQWQLGGNTLMTPQAMGSNNNVNVLFETNNVTRMTLVGATGVNQGFFGIGIGNPATRLEVLDNSRVTSTAFGTSLTTTAGSRVLVDAAGELRVSSTANILNTFATGGRFVINSGIPSNALMTILDNGFTGLGTTAPSSRLQVFGGQISQLQTGSFGLFTAGNEWIGMGVAGTTAFPITSVYGLAMSRGGFAGYYNLVDNGSVKDMIIGFGNEGTTLSSERLRIRSIRTNGTSAPVNRDIMVINPNGYVGVGNDPGAVAFAVDATPAVLPAVAGLVRGISVLTSGSFTSPATASFASIGELVSSSCATNFVVGMRGQNGLSGVNLQVNNSTAELVWQDLNYSGNVSATTGNEVRMNFNFRNNQPGPCNPANSREVMTILANGRVGINTAPGIPNTSGIYNVPPVGGSANFYLEVIGGVLAEGYFAFSDQRFKTNVQTIESPIERIMKMRGTSYIFNAPSNTEGQQGTLQLGFIAQELEQVVPEAVVQGNNGVYAVNYNSITPLLVEGIKEQQNTIVTLTNRVAELEKQLAAQQGNTAPTGGFQEPLPVNPALGNLQQNVPNPFNQQTVINYTVAQNAGVAMLTIYDLNGRQIRAEQLNQRGAGQLVINANELAPGMYIYALIVDGKAADSKRMIVTE